MKESEVKELLMLGARMSALLSEGKDTEELHLVSENYDDGDCERAVDDFLGELSNLEDVLKASPLVVDESWIVENQKGERLVDAKKTNDATYKFLDVPANEAMSFKTCEDARKLLRAIDSIVKGNTPTIKHMVTKVEDWNG